jgi:hypothetical protein
VSILTASQPFRDLSLTHLLNVTRELVSGQEDLRGQSFIAYTSQAYHSSLSMIPLLDWISICSASWEGSKRTRGGGQAPIRKRDAADVHRKSVETDISGVMVGS